MVVADVVDDEADTLAPTTVPIMAGAASHGNAGDLSLLERTDSPAGRPPGASRSSATATARSGSGGPGGAGRS